MQREETMEGQILGGRLVIESVLGVGGMGTVYRARHNVLQRLFAVKVIRQAFRSEPDLAARFRREARMASRVEHPNITSVFDFGYTDFGCPYLVMEYVEGQTLAAVLEKEGALSLDRALPLLLQLANALSAAHRVSVVHRDLKPGNIMLTSDRQGRERVKVTDFGLAKVFGPEATSQISLDGETFGSPPYMAPEQCVDGEVDHRTDIYALGIVAYEMVVGAPPFFGTLMTVLHGHVHAEPPRPSEQAKNAELAPRFDPLVLRCLAKKPSDRYHSADELFAALRELAAEQALPLKHIPSHPAVVGTGGLQAHTGEHTLTPVQASSDLRLTDSGVSSAVLISGRKDVPQEAGSWGGGASQALDELACIARDRGLSTPALSAALARKICLDDQLLTIEARIADIEAEVARLEQVSRQREPRLRVALSQLEQEWRRTDPHLATAATAPIAPIARSHNGMPPGDSLSHVTSVYNHVVRALRENSRTFADRLLHLHQESVQMQQTRESTLRSLATEQRTVRDLLQHVVGALQKNGDLALERLIRQAGLSTVAADK